MSVFLSPVGGAGAQFFNGNGSPLAGGKLYTYAAGTTTPQVTYTSSAGVTLHSNPIVLDAAGRVPGSSEIWLGDGSIYKFVLKDSNDVLQATWDQITGINSNFVNYTTETEVQTATAGQTVFTLTTMTYQPGTGNLTVFVDGVNQYLGTSYVETDGTTVTFTAGLHVGALVKFTTATQATGNATSASVVSYTGFKGQTGVVQDLADDDGADWIGFTPSGTGSLPRSAQEKLRDFVSVLDFGADATGVADSTTAFANALATGKAVYAPKGTYKTNLVISESNKTIFGDGIGQTILSPFAVTEAVLTLDGDVAGQIINNFLFCNFSIEGDARQGNGFLIYNTSDVHGCDQISWVNIAVSACNRGIACYGRSIWNSLQNVYCDYNHDGIWIQTDQAVNSWVMTNIRTSRNRQHGFYAEKTDTTISGFIDFTFINFNSEYNGLDTTIPFIYGLYCNAAEGWSLQNVTFEANGADLPGVESHGALFTGDVGRGIIIDGVWGVQSKYLITISGVKKSGYINNVYRGQHYSGGASVFINASWTTDEPKIELGPNIAGTVYVTYDINGNWPITQGVDYYGGAQTTLSLKNRKNVTINTTAASSTISTITGLVSGDVVFLYNYANTAPNKITLAAGLMASGTAYDISADTGKQFIVLGFPHNGKLAPI